MKDYEITIKIQVQASDSISQDDVLRQLLSGKDYLQEKKDFQFFATPKAVEGEGAFAESGTQIKRQKIRRQSSQMLYFDVQTNVYHIEHCKQYDDGHCSNSRKDDFRKQ